LVSRISGISHFHVPMPFSYERTIHFPDTDAAGVVFFPNYLAICHEAYEEALAAAGMDVKAFFSDRSGVVVPVSHSEADYLRPLRVGDRVRVRLSPVRLSEVSFAIEYELTKLGPVEKRAARLRTEPISISVQTRERTLLPASLAAWIAQG
jgi:1,4-dihydroxy-2-naphthoyl-CoA hydrolase